VVSKVALAALLLMVVHGLRFEAMIVDGGSRIKGCYGGVNKTAFAAVVLIVVHRFKAFYGVSAECPNVCLRRLEEIDTKFSRDGRGIDYQVLNLYLVDLSQNNTLTGSVPDQALKIDGYAVLNEIEGYAVLGIDLARFLVKPGADTPYLPCWIRHM
ncbi:hypothetical protein Tco_0805301, partial [Tanacetum coccineum]